MFEQNIVKFTVGLNEKFDGAVKSSAVCITFISKVDAKLLDGTMALNTTDERSTRGSRKFS